MSAHIISLLRDCKIKSKKSEEVEKSENTQINDVLNNVSPSILSQLDDEFIKNCSTYSECLLNTALEKSNADTSADLLEHSEFAAAEHSEYAAPEQSGLAAHGDNASDRITQLPEGLNTLDSTIPNLVSISSQDDKTGINEDALLNLLADLKANDQLSRKSSEISATHLIELVQSSEKLSSTFTKSELIIFVEILNKAQNKLKIQVYKSWNKTRIAFRVIEKLNCKEQTTQKSTRHKRNP